MAGDVLTKRQSLKLREAYANFEQSPEGGLTPRGLGLLLRVLGHKPTQAKVREVLALNDSGRTGHLHADGYLDLVASVMSREGILAEECRFSDILLEVASQAGPQDRADPDGSWPPCANAPMITRAFWNFKAMDLERRGHVLFQEWANVVAQNHDLPGNFFDDHAETYFKQCDRDADGKLSFQDFVNAAIIEGDVFDVYVGDWVQALYFRLLGADEPAAQAHEYIAAMLRAQQQIQKDRAAGKAV